jgi:hypothetical protein
VDSTVTQLAAVSRERDQLLEENARLRAKYSGARRTLRKVRGHLRAMGEIQRHVSISEAALDCQLESDSE